MAYMESNQLKKFCFFVFLFFLFIFCFNTNAKAAEYEFKFGYWASTHKAGTANDKWSRMVEELSNGRIEINNYPGATIAAEQKSVRMVKAGTLDIGQATTQNMGQFTDIYRTFDVFYVAPSIEAFMRLCEQTDIGEKIDRYLQENSQLKVLYYQPVVGFRAIVNNTREIRVPEDMEGLKLRSTATPIEQKSLRALGANPIPVPFPEVYMGLQQGMIDGLHIDFEAILFSKFYEVVKYGTKIDAQICVEVTVMNLDKWNNLPEDIKNMFDDATRLTFNDRVKYGLGVKNDIQKCEEQGVKVYEPSPVELEIWKKTTQNVAEDLAKEGLIDLEWTEKIRKKLKEIQKGCYIKLN